MEMELDEPTSIYVQKIPLWYLEPENDPAPSAEVVWFRHIAEVSKLDGDE